MDGGLGRFVREKLLIFSCFQSFYSLIPAQFSQTVLSNSLLNEDGAPVGVTDLEMYPSG